MNLKISLIFSLLLQVILGTTWGQADAERKLSRKEQEVVNHCLNIIRGCQHPDGSFNMVDEGKLPGSPVWVAPYFNNYAALALIAAYDHKKNREDLTRVKKWLEWSANNQDSGGFWYDYAGTYGNYKSNGHVDAHDSSAAMFLVVCDRFVNSGGSLSNKCKAAVKRSFDLLNTNTNEDGLTYAKSTYEVKYLMDNIEVRAGYRAAVRLFTNFKDQENIAAAEKQLNLIESSLQKYHGAVRDNEFAWALHPSGSYDSGLEEIYPQGLAQLYGCAFVKADPVAFEAVVSKFQPQTTREGFGTERFLVAACNLDEDLEKEWREKVIADASQFTTKSVYIFRPALVVLGLVEGAEWLK